MSEGDFRSTELSVTVAAPDDVRIEHVAEDGAITVLKPSTPLLAGEVIDASVMRKAALTKFFAEQIADAERQGVLYSVHLKATMMKVSDPIIFGHGLEAFVGTELFEKYDDASPNDGLASLLEEHPEAKAEVDAALAAGPDLFMVDSDKGVTNLHVPSDVIVDASMPALIRSSGQGWNAAGEQQDAKCVIPDSLWRSTTTIEHCRAHGPSTRRRWNHAQCRADGPEGRGIRLARQDIRDRGAGRGSVVDQSGSTLLEHDCRAGDISHVPGQGRPDPRLGRAGRAPRPRHRLACGVLARRGAPARRGSAGQGAR